MSYPRIHADEREGNRVRNQRYRERNREKIRERQRRWQAEYRSNNRDFLNERRRGYYAATPEPHRKRAKLWAAANPEKRREIEARRRAAKKASPTIEKIDRASIYRRDGGRCHICGRPVSRSSYELDHLIPLSRGGPHISDNLAVAHGKCNRRRKDGRLPAQLLMPGVSACLG